MKWIIASDIHGAFDNFTRLLNIFKSEKADKLLILGDSFSSYFDYDSQRIKNLLNHYKDNIVYVKGNCDDYSNISQLDLPVNNYEIINIGNKMVFATHGHLYAPYMLTIDLKIDIFLSGHTHIQECRKDNSGVLMLNPGSLGKPRDGRGYSYMIYEDDIFYWKTLDGENNMMFDITSI
ncbi:MAG: phosphodiesterase [Clostridia bacterium]|nr:phosphodiesterase [Clostridia bacterium]